MTRIGIIGMGRFGRLTARYLASDFEVLVHSQSAAPGDIERIGARQADWGAVCGCNIVIPCVPIRALQQTLQKIAPHLSPQTLVVDVCSVKVLPTQWMRDLLPKEVFILATHPLFGPDSAAQSLAGCKIVLCPARVPKPLFKKINTFLARTGLILIETTPEEHDRQIAVSLSLTHFIGRALSVYGARNLEVDTEGYKRLLNILGVVEHDTWQLFEDMHRYNPFAKQQRQAFMSALAQIEQRLKDES